MGEVDTSDPQSLAKAIAELEKEMRAAAKRLEFEQAAALRDRIREWRARETAAAGSAGPAVAPPSPAVLAPTDADARALRRRWAHLIRRIVEVDPLVCPRCGEAMRIIAFVTEPKVIDRILRHFAAKGIDACSPPTADTDIAAGLTASGSSAPLAACCAPSPGQNFLDQASWCPPMAPDSLRRPFDRLDFGVPSTR